MKLVFEQLIAGNQASKVLNCTEGGLAILGAENMPLQAVLDSLPAEDEATHFPARLQAVADKYQPAPRWDDLEAGIADILRGLDTIEAAAASVLHHAPLWEACVQPEEKAALYDLIHAIDTVFQSEPMAFGQIAIRRFEIIQIVSAIPPSADVSAEDLAKLNVERLRTVSEAVSQDAGEVRRMIRQAQRRIQDIRHLAAGRYPSARLLARQSFRAMQLYARDHGLPTAFVAPLAWHQQRYQGVVACAHDIPEARRLLPRTQRRLAAHQQDIAQLGWEYFNKEASA